MNIVQAESLTDEEMSMVLYILNVVFPLPFPKIEFDSNNVKWHRHDLLMQKLVNAFPRLKPEGHEVYKSMMEKLGVKVEIKQQAPPPAPPVPTSTETSTENSEKIPEVVEQKIDAADNTSTENQPTGSL